MNYDRLLSATNSLDEVFSLKIAFVDEDLSQRTGSRRFTCDVTRQLQRLGHEVEVFTTKLDARKCFQEYLAMPVHVVPGKVLSRKSLARA